MEEILLLLLVDFLTRLLLNLLFELRQLEFALHDVEQLEGAFLDVAFFQEEGLFFRIEREIGSHKVDEQDGVADVLHGKQGFRP